MALWEQMWFKVNELIDLISNSPQSQQLEEGEVFPIAQNVVLVVKGRVSQYWCETKGTLVNKAPVEYET